MLLRAVRVPALTFILLLLVACGGGGGGPPGPEEKNDPKKNSPSLSSVSAFYTKAPVEGATCHLYDLNDEILAGPVISDEGAVVFPSVSYTGEAYTGCGGGRYTDEASGLLVELNSQDIIRSVSTAISQNSNVSLVVTPLTEIAHRNARTSGDTSRTNMLAIATEIADLFGLDNVDITQTQPDSLSSIEGSISDASRYGIVLAAFSQMQQDTRNANTAPTSSDLFSLIDKLESELSTAAFDVASYKQSLVNLTTNSQTKNAITSTSSISSLVGMALPGAKVAPTVSAGKDKSVQAGTTVNITGIGRDVDGVIASYLWQEIGTSSLALNGSTSENLSFTAPMVTVNTTYTLRFSVTDNDGLTASDDVFIAVTAVANPDPLPVGEVPSSEIPDQENVAVWDEFSWDDGSVWQ